MTTRCPFLSSFLVSSGSSATGLDASRPFSLPPPSLHLVFPLIGPRPPPFFPYTPPFPSKKRPPTSGGLSFPDF
jgi:hypothetical protein